MEAERHRKEAKIPNLDQDGLKENRGYEPRCRRNVDHIFSYLVGEKEKKTKKRKP